MQASEKNDFNASTKKKISVVRKELRRKKNHNTATC